MQSKYQYVFYYKYEKRYKLFEYQGHQWFFNDSCKLLYNDEMPKIEKRRWLKHNYDSKKYKLWKFDLTILFKLGFLHQPI